jgi:hypothetical protein
MTERTTRHGWTATSNDLLVRGKRTRHPQTDPADPEPPGLQNPAHTAKSGRSRLWIRANTTIVVCGLILLIITLVVLELHIRSLTAHPSLSPTALSLEPSLERSCSPVRARRWFKPASASDRRHVCFASRSRRHLGVCHCCMVARIRDRRPPFTHRAYS